MINKGDTTDRHPWDILCKISNTQKTCLLIPFKNPTEKHIKLAGNAKPPDGGISHGADTA
jgi:hypothetical protein